MFLGILGDAELSLRIREAKEKYFEGAEEFSFRDLGRSIYYFQGSKTTPPPPPGCLIFIVNTLRLTGMQYNRLILVYAEYLWHKRFSK